MARDYDAMSISDIKTALGRFESSPVACAAADLTAALHAARREADKERLRAEEAERQVAHLLDYLAPNFKIGDRVVAHANTPNPIHAGICAISFCKGGETPGAYYGLAYCQGEDGTPGNGGFGYSTPECKLIADPRFKEAARVR